LEVGKTVEFSLFIAGMRIFVKTLTTIITLNVSSNMPTFTVKQLIEEKEGYPTCEQRLVFSGRLLEDEPILANYNVQPESTLHLIVRMRGY
jgi:hypothetical protein